MHVPVAAGKHAATTRSNLTAIISLIGLMAVLVSAAAAAGVGAGGTLTHSSTRPQQQQKQQQQQPQWMPRTLAAWAHILAAVPGSVLWLLRFPPAGEARLRAALATTGAGVDPARLIFTDVAPKADHLRRCGLADVALDTPLVNAHTTACDVLWAGVPLVTLPGARMAARVAASLARATGCGEAMVAASWAEYEAKAVALGRDADGCRTRLAARLRAAVRGGCELFDTAGWVRDFERLLGRLWEEHVAGRPPTSFDLAKET